MPLISTRKAILGLVKRRTILTSSFAALAAFALLVLAACGGSSDKSATPAVPTSSGNGGDGANGGPSGESGVLGVLPAGSEFVVGENHFVFGITNAEGTAPLGAQQAKAYFYDLSNPSQPKLVYSADATASQPGVGPITEHTHAGGQTHQHGGEDEARAGFYVDMNFAHAGKWGVAVEATTLDGKKGMSTVAFDVFDKPRIPAPGQPAIKSDNLTKADVPDIRQIDSGDPPNDMHDVKIKDAIANGRPMVIVFSTPAYCVSLFCGPVTDEVSELQDAYRDKVDFVHIEIWQDFEKKQFNPTAREWLMRQDGGLSEPFVYVVGKDGVIYDRWEGPVARNIMEPAIQAVADGKTFADRSRG